MARSELTKVLTGRRARRQTAPGWLLLAFGLVAVAAVIGCYNTATGDASIGGAINFKLPAFPETGGNAVQVFTEMHYQPSYRAQEVPRLLPPVGSVPREPRSGGEIVYASMDEYEVLTPDDDYEDDALNGQRLYQVNCLVCHGSNLDGRGPITTYPYSGGPVPANLMAAPTVDSPEVTRTATQGEIFGFISCGGRQGCALRLRGLASASPMPEFRRLLSVEDRWDLAVYLFGVVNAP
jgi:mono/diheme cytochrome c family protein